MHSLQATEAIEDLRQAVDALIIIPNDKLLQSKHQDALACMCTTLSIIHLLLSSQSTSSHESIKRSSPSSDHSRFIAHS